MTVGQTFHSRMIFFRKPVPTFRDHALAAPRDAVLAFRGYGRAVRSVLLPLAALAVIAGIAVGGVGESRAERAATCGLAFTVQDPDLRASLIRFDRQQSASARKVCDLYRDRH